MVASEMDLKVIVLVLIGSCVDGMTAGSTTGLTTLQRNPTPTNYYFSGM